MMYPTTCIMTNQGEYIMKQREKRNKQIIIDTKENCINLVEKDKQIKKLTGVRIGKNGLTDNKEEGDMCTPKGTFKLGFAFGTLSNPSFSYPYYQMNENMYWISDSASPYYNEWVEVTSKKEENPYSYMHQVDQITWQEAEHLIDYPIEYELAMVIEYNMSPKIPNKGSAIFFHVQNKETTSGCVATTKENLLFILEWLEKDEATITIL